MKSAPTKIERVRVAAFALALALLLAPAVSASDGDTASRFAFASWRWRRVPVRPPGGGEALVAVASLPGSPSRVAVAGDGGVSVRRGDAPFRFAARVAGVTDLAFAADGSLWIGSVAGLWHLSADGRLSERSPAPGELARTVHRVRAGPDVVAVGTEAGAWLLTGDRWLRLGGGLPFGPVTALAFGDEHRELWLAVGEEVWRVRLDSGGHAERVAISGAPNGVAPTDVVGGLPGARVAILYPRAVATLVADAPGARPTFRLARPAWPPGAIARRLTGAAGRLWVATDLGLLNAAGLGGPWRRAESPAGSAPVRALSQGRDELLAATGLGLLRGAPVVLAAGRVGSPSTARPPADPDVRAVHAASLRYLDLDPSHMRELRAGIRRRGWLPTLSLRVGAARDRSWNSDYDESFVSGDTRRLNDRERDDSLDLEASLIMTWSLGDLAFDDASIDLSREHRQVVALRDNVIDEINQLYFERRGLLEKLHAPGTPDLDRRALELRAAELAAGLDAWTGGWFSRQPSASP